MAIKELFSLVQSTIDATAGTEIHAGQLVARDVTTGKAVLAARGTAYSSGTVTVTATTNAEFVGLAADDTYRTGNTFIQADPVGATKVAADGTITANNNAYFSSTKRALGDYQDETVTNVTNLTAGSTGYQGPARGLGMYNYTPGTQFIVDDLAVINNKTTSATEDVAETIAWGPGTLLTIGAYNGVGTVSNAGKFVRLVTIATDGLPVARLDKMEGTLGATGTLYYITLI